MLLVVAGGIAAAWWMSQDPPAETGDARPGLREIAEVSLPARSSGPSGEEPASRPSERSAASDPGSKAAETDESNGASVAPSGEGSRSPEERRPAPEAATLPGEIESEEALTRPAREESGPNKASAPPEQRLARFALLPRIGDLPPERREALPRLALNAHVHTREPEERFVLINLSRYGEGDRVAPGLTVTNIFAGGVVLEDSQGRFVLPRP